MTEAALNGARRYLFWVGYDGSRFLEMAKGNTGYGVIDLLRRCLVHALPADSPDDIKLAPSSRTDSKVHAIRTPVIVHTPMECGTLDERPTRKSKFMNYFSGLLSAAIPDGIHLLDFHSVSPGFQPRHHVSYRKYVYRIYTPNAEEHVENGPSIVCFSEQPYAWRVPSRFDARKAAEACRMFEGGTKNFASFWKHNERDRKRGECKSVEKTILHISIGPGEPYRVPNNMFRYYDITIISRSFLREQIRRMVAVIVACACGDRPLDIIKYLFDHPHPKNFHHLGLDHGFVRAPANGLFLADVVYDPRMFVNPVPYLTHGWDNELDDIPEA